jgi:hypothetical protein
MAVVGLEIYFPSVIITCEYMHQENPKKTYLPLLTYCLNALDQIH